MVGEIATEGELEVRKKWGQLLLEGEVTAVAVWRLWRLGRVLVVDQVCDHRSTRE